MSREYGNQANSLAFWMLFLRGFNCFDYGPWQEAQRCRGCGTGFRLPTSHEIEAGIAKSLSEWVCHLCGAGAEMLVPWVGRCTMNLAVDGEKYSYRRWQWVKEDKLPERLRSRLHPSPTPKPSEDDFEARVKAAVEVELALRFQENKKDVPQ